MKFPWTWIIVAVLVLVAYKAGQMSRTEGFVITTYGIYAFMAVSAVILLFVIAAIIYHLVIAPGSYVIKRAGHSMYDGIIKR